MPQAPQTQGPNHRTPVSFQSNHSVRYWMERLGVSAEDVREAYRRIHAMLNDRHQSGRK